MYCHSFLATQNLITTFNVFSTINLLLAKCNVNYSKINLKLNKSCFGQFLLNQYVLLKTVNIKKNKLILTFIFITHALVFYGIWQWKSSRVRYQFAVELPMKPVSNKCILSTRWNDFDPMVFNKTFWQYAVQPWTRIGISNTLYTYIFSLRNCVSNVMWKRNDFQQIRRRLVFTSNLLNGSWSQP